jgi:hypothetical protein
MIEDMQQSHVQGSDISIGEYGDKVFHGVECLMLFLLFDQRHPELKMEGVAAVHPRN